MTADEINVNNSELVRHVHDCQISNQTMGNPKAPCNLETTTRVKTTYGSDIQIIVDLSNINISILTL